MIVRIFKFYLPGIVFIAAAALVMAAPEILVVIVSALIMISGFIALVVGHGIRKSEIRLNKMNEQFQTSGWTRYCSFKSNRIML